MAIPFCEPKNNANANNVDVAVSGDQVDGGPSHINNNNQEYDDDGYDDVDYEAPSSSSSGNNSASTQTWTSNSTDGIAASSSSSPSTAEQIIAWKILALAMCKALKQYHLQSGNSLNTFHSAISIHLYPNGQMKTNMK